MKLSKRRIIASVALILLLVCVYSMKNHAEHTPLSDPSTQQGEIADHSPSVPEIITCIGHTSDPYVGVDKEAFYADYTPACCYADAQYRTQHFLLSGLLTDPKLGIAATVGARIGSSLLNFYMNKKLVFQTQVSTGKAMLRYYALALPQLAAQSLINTGLYALLGITESQAGARTLIHILVMCVLFIASFTIQQRWVFAPEKSNNRG